MAESLLKLQSKERLSGILTWLPSLTTFLLRSEPSPVLRKLLCFLAPDWDQKHSPRPSRTSRRNPERSGAKVAPVLWEPGSLGFFCPDHSVSAVV